MTAPSREPTEAMRLRVQQVAAHLRGHFHYPTWEREVARALAEQDTAARREGFEQAREAAAKVCRTYGSLIMPDQLTDEVSKIAREIRRLTPELPSEKETERGD